jgi:hypothetical protein
MVTVPIVGIVPTVIVRSAHMAIVRRVIVRSVLMVIVPIVGIARTVIVRSARMVIVRRVIARIAGIVPMVIARSVRMVIVPIVATVRTVATAVLLQLVRRPADVAGDTATTVAVGTVTTVALAQDVWIVRRVQQVPRFQMT